MKRVIFFWLTGMALLVSGCSQNTYSNLRDKEDKLLANYISRKGYTILYEEPDINHVWEKDEFYKVVGYDNLYFHLIERGDSIRIDSISPTKVDTVDLKILTNDLIVVRYKQFGLTENADTMS